MYNASTTNLHLHASGGALHTKTEGNTSQGLGINRSSVDKMFADITWTGADFFEVGLTEHWE